MAGLVPAHLAKAYHNDWDAHALCNIVEDLLCDPFGFWVPSASRGGWFNRSLRNRRRDGAVCTRIRT